MVALALDVGLAMQGLNGGLRRTRGRGGERGGGGALPWGPLNAGDRHAHGLGGIRTIGGDEWPHIGCETSATRGMVGGDMGQPPLGVAHLTVDATVEGETRSDDPLHPHRIAAPGRNMVTTRTHAQSIGDDTRTRRDRRVAPPIFSGHRRGKRCIRIVAMDADAELLDNKRRRTTSMITRAKGAARRCLRR